ncbi:MULTISPECIES: 3-hydroxybutyrate dehydrogenase [Nocardiopsis]|uniref:3-hydroxybutyrate dehydrogenase n=1 Tax=Nocardiopsis dassonvillei (strain ATCC 23218 / DSM 43111 / CIP 107115 / JCM 7437 / KCTC 9190 / NBRC 14626 / NCTC 10488 / NRRL B-5397 / IMRU 509) TaxID=446468 RepID=D7B6U5_NOCDD|nr:MULTISPECIES: 3-hydroxybutyrate dehydrogenase [Nocardiopsis]ADH65499.1 3-hydroxybutyrate dehydrogenase [Nocardiopsis dassonvillei subsp. dassonvillei DSM 43111]APC33232.1 3-hydroxybutyrate dehydrogenase [Nocardiopsis dassonvillei]NKY82120.1 3-hydroxybutyrate dehydrogenase [Nocardiopsis dassonvillei]VEI90817.1 D-beta-hydroxybutyrate dehydrogenase [Nocardiopsis dassonvillei]
MTTHEFPSGTARQATRPPVPGTAGNPRTTRVDLTGRTALVTGAASGIGRACALRLADAGARVRMVDLDGRALDELADRGVGEAVELDLTDLDAAEEAARGADVVVNNAGVQTVAPVQDFPPERFSLILRLMVESPFRVVRGALPHMYARGWGRVVNISSVHGLRASAYKSAYVTAKHGLEGFSKVVALEGAAHGVTSNCVNPGYVRTPLVERQIADQAAAHGIPEERVLSEVLLARSPLKRLIEPSEVAELVAYLCGEDASFVNGASLPVDGAWSAS